MTEKRVQSGNEGEPLVPGKTENLSSANHREGDAALPDATIGGGPTDKAVREQFDRREDELDRPD